MSLKVDGSCVGGELSLLKTLTVAQSGVDWTKYPISFSKAEGTALSLPRVMAVLGGEIRSPYEIAGIDSNSCRGVAVSIRKIQLEYIKALAKYEKEVRASLKKDFEVIKDLEKNHKYPDGFQKCIRFVRFIFKTIFRQPLPKDSNDAHVQHEGSSHRRGCLYVIDQFEAERVEKAKKCIDGRILVLIDPVQKMVENSEYNMTYVHELRQLIKVREVFSSNQSSVIKNVDINELIQKLPE